ncbi:MAG TPA: PIN domain-containing protein [Dokdonella sp.]|uniref:PIN domain-containing protein n=1 Tax=Dokdonella sp. TaxID=2291710 RepID=UPI002D7F1324|nr:PIN domain-containing protein [Dokdonella sp.]HET9033607.1 PIN domain-containing protein [Dokdonella sp.]
MINLDTNVLIRLLVDDDMAPQQVIAARARVQSEPSVGIGASVFLETMWVLERSYKYPRSAISEVASQLLAHAKYQIAQRQLLTRALEIHRDSSIGFGDALALAQALGSDAILVTFDRKLARLEGAEAVSTR